MDVRSTNSGEKKPGGKDARRKWLGVGGQLRGDEKGLRIKVRIRGAGGGHRSSSGILDKSKN